MSFFGLNLMARREAPTAAQAARYAGLLVRLAETGGLYEPDAYEVFGERLVLDAEEAGLVLLAPVGTDAEYWKLTRRGRKALRAATQSPAPDRKL